jgi:hypothetical protein
VVQLQSEVSIWKMGVQFPRSKKEMACDQRERVFFSCPALMGYELGIDEEVGEGVSGGYHVRPFSTISLNTLVECVPTGFLKYCSNKVLSSGTLNARKFDGLIFTRFNSSMVSFILLFSAVNFGRADCMRVSTRLKIWYRLGSEGISLAIGRSSLILGSRYVISRGHDAKNENRGYASALILFRLSMKTFAFEAGLLRSIPESIVLVSVARRLPHRCSSTSTEFKKRTICREKFSPNIVDEICNESVATVYLVMIRPRSSGLTVKLAVSHIFFQVVICLTILFNEVSVIFWSSVGIRDNPCSSSCVSSNGL